MQFSAKNTKFTLPRGASRLYQHTLLILLALIQIPAFAMDRWTEQQIAQQLKRQYPQESQWLETPNNPTYAIHRQTSRKDIQGGIIILHELGSHPDKSGLIHNLGTRLPDYGWSTLSVQMPHFKELKQDGRLDTLLDDIRPRILAAIRFFKQRNIINLVLIGHGTSANLGLGFLVTSDNIDTDISAMIGIGFSHQPRQSDWRNISTTLSRSKVPVLDIYAEQDKVSVTDTTAARLAAAQLAGARNDSRPSLDRTAKVKQLALNKTDNLRFRQIMLPGANENFDQHNKQLLKRIRSWLKVYAAGRKIPVK